MIPFPGCVRARTGRGVHVAEGADDEDANLFLSVRHWSLHLAGFQTANEFFEPRIEWPGREVEPLEVGEGRRQSIARERGNHDGNDVAPPRPRRKLERMLGFLLALLAGQ